MTKIITYTDKKGGFSRRADGAEDTTEKKKGLNDPLKMVHRSTLKELFETYKEIVE